MLLRCYGVDTPTKRKKEHLVTVIDKANHGRENAL